MEKHNKDNDILNENHHGGQKNNSTVVAKLSLELEALKENENNKTTAIVSTDLSSAYNKISQKY